MVYRRCPQKPDVATGISSKLMDRFIGPFFVVSKHGNLGWMLKDENGEPDGPWHAKDIRVPPDPG